MDVNDQPRVKETFACWIDIPTINDRLRRNRNSNPTAYQVVVKRLSVM